MPFSKLMTDVVSLIKKNGDRTDDIQASVQDKLIFINGLNILIEPGDLIYRKMSNGAEETYKVIDPGFHEKFHMIHAGYQIKHKKLGLPEARKAIKNITYNNTVNIHGDNKGIAVSGNKNNSTMEDTEFSKNFTQLINLVQELDISDKKQVLQSLNDKKDNKIELQTYLGTLLTRGAEVTTLVPVVGALLGLIG